MPLRHSPKKPKQAPTNAPVPLSMDGPLSDLDSSPSRNVTQRHKSKKEGDTSVELSNFKEDMKAMISSLMCEQQKELQSITSNLKEIQQTNHNIDSAVALLTSQNEEFRKKIDQLESQAKKDGLYITLLEEKVEDMQRLCRKSNIEIKNVPKKNIETKEDLIDMVLCLSKHVNCKIEKSDIKDIYRVQGKKAEDKNLPIIVELGSVILKTDVLKLCKSYNIKNKHKLQAKHLGFTRNEDTPIYVSEQLTPKGARLFFLARDLTKLKKFKYCWTSFGRIYARKDENSPVIIIKNEMQVHHLLQGA